MAVHVSPYEEQEQRGKFYATRAAQNVNQLAPGETWNFVESEISEFTELP